jgi:hypothetical protein
MKVAVEKLFLILAGTALVAGHRSFGARCGDGAGAEINLKTAHKTEKSV